MRVFAQIKGKLAQAILFLEKECRGEQDKRPIYARGGRPFFVCERRGTHQYSAAVSTHEL